MGDCAPKKCENSCNPKKKLTWGPPIKVSFPPFLGGCAPKKCKNSCNPKKNGMDSPRKVISSPFMGDCAPKKCENSCNPKKKLTWGPLRKVHFWQVNLKLKFVIWNYSLLWLNFKKYTGFIDVYYWIRNSLLGNFATLLPLQSWTPVAPLLHRLESDDVWGNQTKFWTGCKKTNLFFFF